MSTINMYKQIINIYSWNIHGFHASLRVYMNSALVSLCLCNCKYSYPFPDFKDSHIMHIEQFNYDENSYGVLLLLPNIIIKQYHHSKIWISMFICSRRNIITDDRSEYKLRYLNGTWLDAIHDISVYRTLSWQGLLIIDNTSYIQV